MRVALVTPPLLSGAVVQPPLGLCTLAAWLTVAKNEVAVVDLDLETKFVSQEPSRAYQPIFESKLADFEPELVAVTSMYNNSVHAEHLIRRSKHRWPHVPVVAGGPHFGAQGPAALRRIPELDFVVEGEGEIGLEHLLEHIRGKRELRAVHNLCYRQAGKPVRNGPAQLLDLERLPNVWSTIEGVLDLSRYVRTIPSHDTRRGLYIEAGRGCPFRCTFCAPAAFWSRKYRVRPTSNIVAEAAYLHHKFGYEFFVLVHDLLTVDRRFVEELCDRFLDVGIELQWMANARTDLHLSPLFSKMRRAGCTKLFFGIESGSPRVQTEIDKHLSRDECVKAVAQATKHGIDATCSFVIGLPTETVEDLHLSITLGAQLRLLGSETVQFHRVRLFPPAPLAATVTSVELDLETLRLEYPFKSLDDGDLFTIRNDPLFYSGYLAPRSAAGTARQLAMVELLFTQAVAILPLTVAALAGFAGAGLLHNFYDVLDSSPPPDRFAFDPTNVDLLRNFLALEPYVLSLLNIVTNDEHWRAALARAIVDYESARICMLYGSRQQRRGWRYYHDGCLELQLQCDLGRVLRLLQVGDPLSNTHLEQSTVLLIRHAPGVVRVLQSQVEYVDAD